LRQTEIFLTQIKDETQKYYNLLTAALPLQSLIAPTDIENSDEAYNTIDIASRAVNSVDVDLIEDETLESLEDAVEGLQDATAFLESNPPQIEQLLRDHPGAPEDLSTLENDVTDKLEEVLEKIEEIPTTDTTIPTRSTTPSRASSYNSFMGIVVSMTILHRLISS